MPAHKPRPPKGQPAPGWFKRTGRAGPGQPASTPPPDSQPNLWSLAGLGLELAAGVAGFALLGWWLDNRWSTSPWLLMTGAGLGFVGGLYNLWQRTKKYL